MTTPADICDRIALIGQDITGIVETDAISLATIDTANMPYLAVFMGRSSDDEVSGGDDFTIETRVYRIVVVVMPIGQGETAEAEDKSRDLIHAVKEHYRARHSLEDLAGVQNTRVLGDSGVIVLPEYSGKYFGFEVLLEVSLYVPKTFVDY
jgi:hypothetical protein